MRRFVIDTDTASDDAVALVMALRHPEVRVEAITVVAGNVPLEQAAQNALYTVELAGARVPVYAGAAEPLSRPLETAQHVHGVDGMGDIGLPLSGRQPAPGYAPEVIVDTINAAPREITLVTLGPLTNIALALRLDPALATKVAGCVVMGGTGRGPGNVTDDAEFNIWVDPEAAQVVFESGMRIKLVGWDVSCTYATLGPEDAARLRAIDTDLARFCVDIQATLNRYAIDESGLSGFDLPDPVAMAIAIDPDIATFALVFKAFVDPSSRGVIRLFSGSEMELVFEADRERFLAMLHRAVAP